MVTWIEWLQGNMMVLGMALPSGFGEFWPEGEFEGYNAKGGQDWFGRLNIYYFQQSPSKQLKLGAGQIMLGDYAYYVCGKFKNEIGVRVSNDPPFTPIQDNEPPQSFDTEKNYGAIGSLIKLDSMLLAVDESLKTIIERLEPGVHQFFPLEIRMPKGAAYPTIYYTLVVGQYFDAFLPEDSNAASWHERAANRYGYNPSKAAMAGLAFSKAVIGNAHLWRDRRFGPELTCFSDTLVAEIEKAGLRIPKHYPMKEV